MLGLLTFLAAIYSPAEAEAALRVCPEACPFVALSLFAGLRPYETYRLTRAAVTPGEGVRVPASAAKTRRARFIEDRFFAITLKSVVTSDFKIGFRWTFPENSGL